MHGSWKVNKNETDGKDSIYIPISNAGVAVAIVWYRKETHWSDLLKQHV